MHHIKTTGPPATSRFRRLDAAKLVAAKADFMKLERDGIIMVNVFIEPKL
jgi:hypothetical protein